MSTRHSYLDSVGGIMIIHMMFVVHAARFTHVCPEFVESLMELLTCFLPWFYFKSGMFYKDGVSLKEDLAKRAKKLLLPFAVFSFIGWFLIYFIGSLWLTDASVTELLQESVSTFIWEGAFNGNFALWFLFSLFLVCVTYRLLRRVRINNRVIMLLSFAGAWGIHQFDLSLPTYIGNVCNGLLFYSLGVELKEKQFNNVLFYVCSLILVISAFFPSYLDFRANKIIMGHQYYLLAELYCFAGIIFFNNIFYRFFPKRIPLLTHVGENSMKYYVVHYIFLIGLFRVLTIMFHLSSPVTLFLIIAVIMSILLYLSGIILSKEPFSRLMGEHKK